MLEESLVNGHLSLLAEYYKQDISPPIAKIFYRYLAENLNEAEFLEAIQLVIETMPPKKGMPSPVEIVELIRGSKQAKAYEEWQIIVKASAANDVDQLAYLSTRGHVALNAIGGLGAVAYHEGSLNWLQKDFVTVYCQCSDKDVHILKPARVENPLPNYTAEVEDRISPEKWAELRSMIKKIGH